MTERVNETGAATPPRNKYGPLYFIGLPLLCCGTVTAVMFTMNHLKQQPPEPLIIDWTLQRGYGGFMVYGVAAAFLGFVLMLISIRPPRR